MWSRILLVALTSALLMAQTPSVIGFGNPAGTNSYAPGSQAYVIGKDLAGATAACGTPAGWPMSCSDTIVVFFDNNKEVQAAVNAVSPGQVIFQIPVELSTGMIPVTIARKIGNANVGSPMIGLQIDPYAPGLLPRGDVSGNLGQFLDNSNAQITSANPAAPGDSISVIAIGLGATSPQAQTGKPPSAALPTVGVPKVNVAGQAATVVFSILIPGQVGLYQVKFRVPDGIPAGNQSVDLEIGGKKSNAVLLPVRAPTAPAVRAVANAATGQPGVSAGSWFSIFGSNLSTTTRPWQNSDFSGNKLPVSLDGVTVTVNGKSAAISYIGPAQINALAPADATLGSVAVEVRNPLGTARGSATLQTFAPGFFIFSSVEQGKYLAAVHPDGVYVGRPDLFQGAAAARPAKAGGVILLFGTAFGPTDPPVPSGEVFTGAAPLSNPGQLTLKIGGLPASVQFAGLIGAGLYQFNVAVPDVPAGDQAVVAEIGGVASQSGKFITVE